MEITFSSTFRKLALYDHGFLGLFDAKCYRALLCCLRFIVSACYCSMCGSLKHVHGYVMSLLHILFRLAFDLQMMLMRLAGMTKGCPMRCQEIINYQYRPFTITHPADLILFCCSDNLPHILHQCEGRRWV